MASHERQTPLLPSDQLPSTDCDICPEESNVMSPKGPLSCGSSYSSRSDLSSPIGSEMGWTETESEDEVLLAELTRRMAEYMFQDDDDDDHLYEKTAPNTLPENSEASGFSLSSKWSQCNSGYVYDCSQQGFMTTSEKTTPTNTATDSALAKKPDSEIYSDQVLVEEQMSPVQVYELKNQPQTRKQGLGGYDGGRRVKAGGTEHKEHHNMQQQNNKGKAGRFGSHGKKGNPPHISAQGGSGMRAVFLGGSNTRNGSSGTGVFLPSGSYSTTEPKRKPGCSTVLIPARVLQTLQQHFNNVGAQSQSSGGDGGSKNEPWQNDVLTRINGLLSQQKEHAEFQTRPAPATNCDQEEVQLPQEWTY